MPILPDYAELHCCSNFTFLRGASHPEELISRAAALGYAALALTDECSVAGAVRAHLAAREHGLRLIVGSQFQLSEGLRFVLLATDRASFGRLTRLITVARTAAPKGSYRLSADKLAAHIPTGCLALWLPAHVPDRAQGAWLASHFPDATWIGVTLLLQAGDRSRLDALRELGGDLQLPLAAVGDVHMHCRQRRVLQDVLTAIRLGTPVCRLGHALYCNAERHLRSRRRLARIYPLELLAETRNIADRCRFSLDELRYEYPRELVPERHTPISWLRKLAEQGMQERWPDGAPERVRNVLAHELELVQELHYEAYFLTVHDIVQFARSQGILCQGRGSAANSVICYCLGITEVDPARMNLLFERFVSRERNEPPDIDVDFEHQRREEVIQYIYRKYSRDRAALAATVITYQPRSAIRDVGKALDLNPDQIDRLAKSIQWWDQELLRAEVIAQLGLAPDSQILQRLLECAQELIGFPRHLSQHVGGFVIAEGALSELVPIENASMPERTVIQWDKDDLEALGLLKVDVLGLGMLSAIRRALEYLAEYTGRQWGMMDIPAEDSAVYRMLHKADTVGVFQIESRAQMSMLPRLRPTCYYDLVIQIAIVRPGPIQGEMVHPYLRRRSGAEPFSYPSEAVQRVLERTLGVPIFQEQVMQLAIVAAGFTPGEADQLRRSMAAWRRRGGLEKFQHKLIRGMQEHGYEKRFAEQISRQIQGFGEYGFPESHSASFALLAYVSSWLKCYHPAAFTCALLNSQPMGFYGPAQLIQDARRHGVKVHPVDVLRSAPECALESSTGDTAPALRLGLKLVRGLSEAGISRLVAARGEGVFHDVQDLRTRAALDRGDMESLAAADALRSLSGHRHRAFWDVCGTQPPCAVFPAPVFAEASPLIRRPAESEEIAADYASVGLTLRRHPLALLRGRLRNAGVYAAERLRDLPNGANVRGAGLVICRQRPGSASGVIFLTLEDETGHINVVVWPRVAETHRQALLQARLLAVTGSVQQEEGVLHLIAKRLEDYSAWLGRLQAPSRNFH